MNASGKMNNTSGYSRGISGSATPRKRLRIESFGENDENPMETPKTRRRRPQSPLPPLTHTQMLRNSAPLPPPGVAFFASKMEEKLADLEVETRQEIKEMFKIFAAEIQKTFAAQKELNNKAKIHHQQK